MNVGWKVFEGRKLEVSKALVRYAVFGRCCVSGEVLDCAFSFSFGQGFVDFVVGRAHIKMASLRECDIVGCERGLEFCPVGFFRAW